MNTVQMRLFFMVFAAFCALALAQNAPELAISEKTVVKKGIGKLAVLRPKVSTGIDEGTIETLWSALESLAAKYGPYTVILRNDKDLSGQIKEIGFQNTDLVEKRGEKAQPGKIKAVDTLLSSSIGKFGDTWTLDLKIVNAETGTINGNYNVHNTFNSLDDIANTLEGQVQLLFKGKEEIKDAMLLEPVCAEGVKISGKVFVAALKKNIFTRLNISITKLEASLKKMGKKDISELQEVDWSQFRREANVRYLVIPTITCWKLKDGEKKIYNEDKIVVRVIKICTLTAKCEIEVIDTRNGSTKHRIQLEENTDNWEAGNGIEEISVTDFKENCHVKVFEEWGIEASGKLVNSISELKALEKN